jgi:5-keto-L-gluconate epimerase
MTNLKYGTTVSTFPTSFAPIMLSGDLPHSLALLSEMGFQGIDLFVRRADEPGLDKVINGIHTSGLKVTLVAAVSAFVEEGLFLSSPTLEVRLKLIERMKLQIYLAASLGAMVPIGLLRGQEGGEERLKLLADSLFELYRFAEPVGVSLVLEPINRYETHLINTIQDVFDFLNHFGLPPLGVMPDVFHMNIEEASIESALSLAGNRIAHVHFADSNRRVPGKGHLNWLAVFSALSQVNYQGFCSLECIPSTDPLQDLRDGLSFLGKF